LGQRRCLLAFAYMGTKFRYMDRSQYFPASRNCEFDENHWAELYKTLASAAFSDARGRPTAPECYVAQAERIAMLVRRCFP